MAGMHLRWTTRMEDARSEIIERGGYIVHLLTDGLFVAALPEDFDCAGAGGLIYPGQRKIRRDYPEQSNENRGLRADRASDGAEREV